MLPEGAHAADSRTEAGLSWLPSVSVLSWALGPGYAGNRQEIGLSGQYPGCEEG